MFRTLLAAITVTALLVSSALPAYAEYYHRGGGYGYGGGGGWHGGRWNGGDGATLGLGLGLGLLGGALARLPTIQHPITQHPATPLLQSPHHLVLVRSISAILPICSHVPGSMATGGPVNDLKSIPSKSE